MILVFIVAPFTNSSYGRSLGRLPGTQRYLTVDETASIDDRNQAKTSFLSECAKRSCAPHKLLLSFSLAPLSLEFLMC
jgi:hypothetical protein